MLNFHYTYAVLWSTTLLLYLFGWSGLNGGLDPILVSFFLITIILSLLFGRVTAKRFMYTRSDLKSIEWKTIIFIVVCSILAFIQLGYVPLVDYFSSTMDYQQFREADKSIFNTIAIVGSVYGTVFQFLIWSETHKRESLSKLLVFIIVLLLFTSRGPLTICVYCCVAIAVSRRRVRLTRRKMILIFASIITALFFFGIVGNIRSGSEWNDSSYIYSLGFFQGYWPDPLPRELCWAYSYLTSPLANLNYSLRFEMSPDIINFVYDFIPLMISKRLPLYVPPSAPLQVSYFTVSSVWSDYYQHLSYFGVFLGYIVQMVILELLNNHAYNTQYKVLMNVFSAECVAFSFFVNSFTYPTMGYPLIIVLIITMFKKRNHANRVDSQLLLQSLESNNA